MNLKVVEKPLDCIRHELTELVGQGIFSHGELAKALCLSLDDFYLAIDEDTRIYIDKLVVDHKIDLISRMRYFSKDGSDHEVVQMQATKFLLAALHALTEKNSIDKQTLELKKQTQRFNQTLKAAKMSTEWEEGFTEKFIENVKKMDKVIGIEGIE